jgi:hypothetical protein
MGLSFAWNDSAGGGSELGIRNWELGIRNFGFRISEFEFVDVRKQIVNINDSARAWARFFGQGGER